MDPSIYRLLHSESPFADLKAGIFSIWSPPLCRIEMSCLQLASDVQCEKWRPSFSKIWRPPISKMAAQYAAVDATAVCNSPLFIRLLRQTWRRNFWMTHKSCIFFKSCSIIQNIKNASHEYLRLGSLVGSGPRNINYRLRSYVRFLARYICASTKMKSLVSLVFKNFIFLTQEAPVTSFLFSSAETPFKKSSIFPQPVIFIPWE